MTVQGKALSMVWLWGDPQLAPGVHLRWTVQPMRGFPLLGFKLFRRPHLPTGPVEAMFGEEEPRQLAWPVTLGGTVWTSPVTDVAPRLERFFTGELDFTGLVLPTPALCRIDTPATPGPLRRIEVIVHYGPEMAGMLNIWGVAGDRRVTPAGVWSIPAGADVVLTISVRGDTLDGFQLLGTLGQILAVRWFSALDPPSPAAPLWPEEALNPQAIGFPVTAPGYQVPHAHSPDQGAGMEDWAEASDRLSAEPSTVAPPAELLRRLGPPVFGRTRQLLQDALARQALVAPGAGGSPQVALDPSAMVLVASLDADVARMLGLHFRDTTAEPGTLYDYKIVATWPEMVPGWVCEKEPVIGVTPEDFRWICHPGEVQATEEWICWEVGSADPPPPARPAPVSGRVLPTLARPGRPGQIVGLKVGPRPILPDSRLLPMALLATDPVAYQARRRADGEQPNPNPDDGAWVEVGRDAAGWPTPMLGSSLRPPTHIAPPPPGWPVELQDVLDRTIDPDVRFYSYRLRGRDAFGRFSDWSDLVPLDAADRIAPPLVDRLDARWLDAADPWLGEDERAALAKAGAPDAVRVRWAWPAARREQAPDAAAFRVYWHPDAFATLGGTITAVQPLDGAAVIQVLLPGLSTPPPADAFAGDWLRQNDRPYLVLASTAANPSELRVRQDDLPPIAQGPCCIALRPPDLQRFDLFGSPLRTDPSSPLAWQVRLLDGPVTTVAGTIARQMPGMAVTVAEVRADTPHASSATVRLGDGWRWAGYLPDGLELRAGGAAWRIVAGDLGLAPSLVLDTSGQAAPVSGPAILADATGQLLTVALDAGLPNPGPFAVLGGTLRSDAGETPVVGHQAGGSLVVAVWGTVAGPQAAWFPEHEVLLAGLPLPVDPAAPEATGSIGVSARDGRAYAPDRRGGRDEPSAPGNEGPVARVAVRRHYRALPTAQVAPAGVDELWTPPPDPFSGRSRFVLRWPAAAGLRYWVFHTTLDGVLDADQADRAAARGAYQGQQPLFGEALDRWRTQQAALDPRGLQALATAQDRAFQPLVPEPVSSSDPDVADPGVPGSLRWPAPLDGNAPGRHFLRLAVVDAAGNRGPLGPSTPPIRVPDMRRAATPALRRARGDDRAIWLEWDAVDPDIAEYRVYRTRQKAGAQPDLRVMEEIARLPAEQCRRPLAVAGGVLRLPGPAPAALVAVYDAALYDPARPAASQLEFPLADDLTLADGTIAGLTSLGEGSLAYAVVRYAADGAPVLAVNGAANAYRDDGAVPGLPHQYRVVAVRQAQIGPATFVAVGSFPSTVGEATATDVRPPRPPEASAAWRDGERKMRISWPVEIRGASLLLALQRRTPDGAGWSWIGGWTPMSRGYLDDPDAVSGETYLYRLRARSGAGRISRNEPILGPVSVP